MVAASAAIRSGDLVNTASSIRFGPFLVFCATIFKTQNVVLFLPQLVRLGNWKDSRHRRSVYWQWLPRDKSAEIQDWLFLTPRKMFDSYHHVQCLSSILRSISHNWFYPYSHADHWHCTVPLLCNVTTTVMSSDLHCCFIPKGSQVEFSTQRPAILTGCFHWFPRSLL
jgi:hypothetical protein